MVGCNLIYSECVKAFLYVFVAYSMVPKGKTQSLFSVMMNDDDEKLYLKHGKNISMTIENKGEIYLK